MAVLIEGKFRDLDQASSILYARVDELTIKRSIGVIEIKLDFFMHLDAAQEYKIHSLKTLKNKNNLSVTTDPENLPLNLKYLQYYEDGEWKPFQVNERLTLLAFSEGVELIEIPTFEVVEQKESIVDFDESGNQIVFEKIKKKPVKKIQQTRENSIYKINKDYLNEPYGWVYKKISSYLAETFKDFNIKKI